MLTLASQQTRFLIQLQTTAVATAIYLKNGVKFLGLITAFDDDVIVLRHEPISHMVFKNTMSTVSIQIQTAKECL